MFLILELVIVKDLDLGLVQSPLSMEHRLRENTGSITGQDSSLMILNPVLFCKSMQSLYDLNALQVSYPAR